MDLANTNRWKRETSTLYVLEVGRREKNIWKENPGSWRKKNSMRKTGNFLREKGKKWRCWEAKTSYPREKRYLVNARSEGSTRRGGVMLR